MLKSGNLHDFELQLRDMANSFSDLVASGLLNAASFATEDEQKALAEGRRW